MANSITDRPKKASFVRVRLQIAIMGLLCPIVCYVSRQNLSMAIIAMVTNEKALTASSWQDVTETMAPLAAIETAQTPAFDLLNHTDHNPTVTGRRPFDSDDVGGGDGGSLGDSEPCTLPRKQVEDVGEVSVEAETNGPTYAWSASEKGLIMEAFFYPYVIFQIPAARYAEVIGPKWILAFATIGSSILSLLSPWAASISPYLFAMLRATLGICQTALYPACYVLYTRWLPPTERSLALPVLSVGAYVGAIVAVITTGYFAEQKSFGWEYAFYLPSLLCAAWSIIWILVGSSGPREHKYISVEELEYIESSLTSDSTSSEAKQKQKLSPSWGKIFKSQHIWAMLAAFMASNWSFSIIIMLLPSYLNDILRIPPFKNSLINAAIYILYCISSPIVGAVSTLMIEVRAFGLKRIHIRKLFQSIAIFSQAAAFIWLPYLGCDRAAVLSILYLQIVLYSFNNGGEVQLPAEISMDFAGTIYAIGNSFGSSTGFLVPRIHSLIVTSIGNRVQWNLYFDIAAAVTSICGLTFLLFGKNDPQDFSKGSKHVDVYNLNDGGPFLVSVAKSNQANCEKKGQQQQTNNYDHQHNNSNKGLEKQN